MDKKDINCNENGTSISSDKISTTYSQTEPQTMGKCDVIKTSIANNTLMVVTFAAVIVGFALGFGLRPLNLSSDALLWIGLPGEIFLNMLSMLIIPLIAASIIKATGSMDPKENGRLGALMLGYIVVTNMLGAGIGTVLQALAATPATNVTSDNGGNSETDLMPMQTGDIFIDLFRNLLPENIFRAKLQSRVTQYSTVVEVEEIYNSTLNDTYFVNTTLVTKQKSWSDSTNLLGIIVVSAFFGIASNAVQDAGRPFMNFFVSVLEVTLRVLQWFVWFTPVGVISLITIAIAPIDDLQDTFTKVGIFVAVVTGGCLIQQLVVLPLFHLAITGKNPYVWYGKWIEVWLISFATSSKSVGMPFAFKAGEKLNINSKIVEFCIPIGVTLNKDGSALFIAAATVFMSQLEGMTLNIGQYCIIWLLTFITTLAVPPIPSASIVLLLMVCSSVGIPTSNLGLLFAVEWFLDRMRTTSNSVGDLYAMGFTQRFAGLEDKERSGDYMSSAL